MNSHELLISESSGDIYYSEFLNGVKSKSFTQSVEY